MKHIFINIVVRIVFNILRVKTNLPNEPSREQGRSSALSPGLSDLTAVANVVPWLFATV